MLGNEWRVNYVGFGYADQLSRLVGSEIGGDGAAVPAVASSVAGGTTVPSKRQGGASVRHARVAAAAAVPAPKFVARFTVSLTLQITTEKVRPRPPPRPPPPPLCAWTPLAHRPSPFSVVRPAAPQGNLLIDRASERGIANAIATAVPLADANHQLKLTSVKVGALAPTEAVAAELVSLQHSAKSNIMAASTGALVGFQLLATSKADAAKFSARLQASQFSTDLAKQLTSNGVGSGVQLQLALSPPISAAVLQHKTAPQWSTRSRSAMLLGVAGTALLVICGAAAAAGCQIRRKSGYHELQAEGHDWRGAAADAHRAQAMEMSRTSGTAAVGSSNRYEEEVEI